MSQNPEIKLTITMENGQLKVSADQSKEKIEDLGKSVKGLSGAFKMLGKLFVVKQLYDLAKSALTSSAAFEKHKIAFETMLGSASKAKKLLKDIKKFSATTPFQLPGIIETSKQLLAFGISEDQVIEKMRNLGNAAQGNQEAFQRLSYAYGKSAAKGKVSMEELNMFTEAGVPLMQALADQYGVSTTKLFKLVETGKVGFKDVDKAITTMTTNGGKFAGMLEKQSKSLGGMFSTMLDNINLLVLSFGDSLSPAFKNLISAMSRFVQAGGIVGMIFTKIGQTVSLFINGLALTINLFDKFTNKIKIFWQQRKVQSAFDDIKDAKGKKELFKALKKADVELNKLAKLKKEQLKVGKEINKINKESNSIAKELFGLEKKIEKIDKTPGRTRKKKKKKNDTDDSGKTGKADKAKEKLLQGWNDRIRTYHMSELALIEDKYDKELQLARKTVTEKKKLAEIEKQIQKEKNDAINSYALEKMTQYLGFSSNIISQVGQIENMRFSNKMALMDEWYANEVEKITASGATEEEKENRLAILKANLEAKQKKEKIKNAKFQKRLSLMQAMVELPAAIISTFKNMGGYPWGIIPAGIMAGIGAWRIAEIARTPVPELAQGGLATRDTLARIGEGRYQEAVLPLSTDVYSKIGKGISRAQQNVSHSNQTHYHIDGIIDTGGLSEIVESNIAENAKNRGAEMYSFEGAY